MKDQTAATPAVPGNARRASTRLVQREPSDRVVAIGLRDRWLGDLYHHLLTLPWWGFLLGLAAVYLGLNILFAVLYLLGDAAIANARPGAFSDAFFFSVETISTIGYGQMSPATLYGNLVMTVEAMFGLILLASSAGLVLARFSRPTARVIFSKVAVVAPYNGVPTLSFRLANERRNQILEAQVAVTLVRDERTAEGEWMRRFYDLQLARQRTSPPSARARARARGGSENQRPWPADKVETVVDRSADPVREKCPHTLRRSDRRDSRRFLKFGKPSRSFSCYARTAKAKRAA